MFDCNVEDLRIRLLKLQSHRFDLLEYGSRTPAAVLIPFACIEDGWNLIFTKRTNGVAKHQGEISFPGGAVEPGDRNFSETALRETYEEIGIKPDQIEIIGTLEPIPTISDYCVIPVLGIVNTIKDIKINNDEVEKILTIPVKWLVENENHYYSEYEYQNGQKMTLLHYKDYQGEHVWGLTARITKRVLDQI